MSSNTDQKRCLWSLKTKSEQSYHDSEWGVPVYDDRLLFEMLTLEGAQAGLSWSTVLNKREGYKIAFDNFDVKKIASYSKDRIEELKVNSGIVRNKLKIASTITNAIAFIAVQKEFGSFSNYIWKFVDRQPIQNNFEEVTEVPVSTTLSDQISKDLKKRGFKFVGTTICYAFIQAVGLVNDHVTTCFRHKDCQ